MSNLSVNCQQYGDKTDQVTFIVLSQRRLVTIFANLIFILEHSI